MKRKNPCCPNCACRRWRNVGAINGLSDAGKSECIKRVIECMRCGHVWDIDGKKMKERK